MTRSSLADAENRSPAGGRAGKRRDVGEATARAQRDRSEVGVPFSRSPGESGSGRDALAAVIDEIVHPRHLSPADAPIPVELDPGTPEPAARARSRRRPELTGRLVKTAAGLAIVGLVGFVPAMRLLESASTEAVVNARLVTIRAPIDGVVELGPEAAVVGAPVASGSVIMHIANRRTDRGRLDDLLRLIDATEDERAAIGERITLLKAQRDRLVEQTQFFQQGRVRQLEARTAEIESQIAAAAATRTEASAARQRTSSLVLSGSQSRAALDRAQRDDEVATETEAMLRGRLTGVEVELEAARLGRFVGDGYNDRPSSSQQADDATIRIGELQAELRLRNERLDRLQAELREERARYADRSAADLTAPVSGTVWEVLTAPGEEVRRGQDLVRVLDCAGAVVTAAVSESVFNGLHVGDPAHFRLVGDSDDHAGRVVRLSGLAAPADNLAIDPSALAKQLYRVTVSVPDLAGAHCAVGRSGKVAFDPTATPDAWHAIGSRLSGALAWR